VDYIEILKGNGSMAFKRLCKTNDVPEGELREFHILNQDILVANVDGQLHCLSARCPHAGAPLVRGILKGEELECPWHYASFRVTDGSKIYGEPKKPLNVYSCEVKGDNLFIDL
jgi:nitrite reductase/ring-hydroxylating ferredoxin subunit